MQNHSPCSDHPPPPSSLQYGSRMVFFTFAIHKLRFYWVPHFLRKHTLCDRSNSRDCAWELQVLLTKTKAGLHCWSMYAKQMGGKLFQGIQAQGKLGLCSVQLAGDCCKVVPLCTGHLNRGRPCGAMKMAKSCKEGAAASQSPGPKWFLNHFETPL